MAKSRYEYVKLFEQADQCLRNCWIVVRLDGRCFHKFSSQHRFKKPNDDRALNLMNHCGKAVMKEFPDIILGYGQSDEFSFIFKKSCNLFGRRASKLMTNVTSLFSSSYVFYWKNYFNDILQYPPTFDGRVVLYPSDKNLRDYLSWRQADCHINNLYNTSFWALVQQGQYSLPDAEKKLCGTDSGDKNELLFSQFQINYDKEPAIFRKGSILLWKENVVRKRKDVVVEHVDIIGDNFWTGNSQLLS
ncbi:uncharacterized protein TRIADDRAFT_32525 [Trichoplax adhaerens]|uniref:tRNA(His) guanylyltransferase n=1 Tax=Trichoplax adhaerens TaxID=10228 RepID=B3SB59_TRIAD|nr:hypothetical protein TRIADDRAFT_32525 [Trichoplax adhaerens]EDV20051.1 hypothetical protein TRIADDRAFT_32525 [Trichoplax adhaerens]|eukprot:XP_002117435.1 hypothetical protein TRIADDRAFT_32525 [Trichoplax adhaerens]